jgi:hypothetical protein
MKKPPSLYQTLDQLNRRRLKSYLTKIVMEAKKKKEPLKPETGLDWWPGGLIFPADRLGKLKELLRKYHYSCMDDVEPIISRHLDKGLAENAVRIDKGDTVLS